tara:strand:+ start:2489 stop:4684 length:2196 start_codon:yes stop_codon:yes gene_type:complete
LKDLLLITPPFTQLNTPYPATAYLKGFLNTKQLSSHQMDLGMEVILQLFSQKGLRSIFGFAQENSGIASDNGKRIFALRQRYLQTIESVISFLQGSNDSFARQICTPDYLPQASRFDQLDDLEWAFGTMGLHDRAKHLATLYLEDISDFIVECVDENFGFSRYAERLGRSANSFDNLYEQLQRPPSYIDQIATSILTEKMIGIRPKMVCFSVPFPGNLYSAFRCAEYIRQSHPSVKTVMGGGFPNTELRSLKDVRVFQYFHFITLDDGELPIELLVDKLLHGHEATLVPLKRTFHLREGEVFYNDLSTRPDYKQAAVGTPDYGDLLLDKYISVIEVANPMHSLWSDGRWMKLTMAHGCYWGKCTFCDVSLDYIKIYEPITATLLVDRMEEMIAQTGERGFHFVDEAAPPSLMKALALEIIKRQLSVSWWTNIRFEKNFGPDLCQLLRASGCIAVSGGLEVASDRLLSLIKKGVTVAQVAQVTHNFTKVGIMVHSYLMYGYPTQTVQETVDSLEMVRQMFRLGILKSGFWHQFALTAHSPIGQNPSQYHIDPIYEEIGFANNDIQFRDKTGIDHDQFSYGLKKSLFNYMHGIGMEEPLQKWFPFKIPKTAIPPNYIQNALESEPLLNTRPNAKICWLGAAPTAHHITKSKKGQSWQLIQLHFHGPTQQLELRLDRAQGEWLLKMLDRTSVYAATLPTFAQLKSDFEPKFGDFEPFWYSKPLIRLKENGLLSL